MTQGGAGKCGNTLLKVWLIALASCVCSSAWAQTNTEQQYLFDLQAAPMHESLVEYSKITRRSVLYESRLLRNKYSPALQGRYTASAALAHLLQGSGLHVKLTANGFALQPLAPAATARAQGAQVMAQYEQAVRHKIAVQLCRAARSVVTERIAMQIWLDEQARINPIRLHTGQGDAVEEQLRQVLTGLYVGPPPSGVVWPLTLVLQPSGAHRLCHP